MDREADQLPDEAIVVRGGAMLPNDLQTGAEIHAVEHPGEWAISVGADADADADEIARRSPFRHRQMRVARVGDIRALGHDVVPSGKKPHADLKLRGKPDDEMWDELQSVFGEPVNNPRYN